MDTHSVNIAARVATPVSAAGVGLLFQDYNGHPAWVIIFALTVSLAFGIASSIGRSKDRSAAFSISKWNAGSLWIIAFVSVFKGNLDIPTAMITALILGLVGSPVIDQLEKKIGPWLS